MKAVFRPESEEERLLAISLLEAENIVFLVHNDHFGSLVRGPSIHLYNAKTILVAEESFETAKALIDSCLPEIRRTTPAYGRKNKIRMVLEAILFGWFVPGGRRFQKTIPRHANDPAPGRNASDAGARGSDG
jgi:hypothetical protein